VRTNLSRERILITGGAGFIGCHTAVAFLERGYDVRCLDSLRPPVHNTEVAPPWLPNDVEFLRGDVRDERVVTRALQEVDVVVHLAAYQDYLPDFSTFFSVNTGGTALLYEVIVRDRLDVRKVVVASSQAVYGEGNHACEEHRDIQPDIRGDMQLSAGRWEVECPVCGRQTRWDRTDESSVNPHNQYALSKYTQEMVAFSLGRRFSLPTTCLRYSITQGRWQNPRNAYSGICRIFTSRVLNEKAPVIFEDGRQVRDYVYVGDVAKANVIAVEDPRTDFEAYNVGGCGAVSAIAYARKVIGVLGSTKQAEVPGLYRFGDVRHIVSSTRKLEALGWKSSFGVEAVIREYADWIVSTQFGDTSDASLAHMLDIGTVRSCSSREVRTMHQKLKAR
jgi:dTDP-L-rhamnose 4-epimerase